MSSPQRTTVTLKFNMSNMELNIFLTPLALPTTHLLHLYFLSEVVTAIHSLNNARNLGALLDSFLTAIKYLMWITGMVS